MATPPVNGMLPLARPTRPSTRQVSRRKVRAIRSAARCCVFRGQKLELLKDEQLINVQSQPECRSESFLYSAGSPSPAASVSVSATNTGRQTAPVTQVYGRKTASYIHYLDRRIKLIAAKVDSYSHDLDSEISLLRPKMEIYADRLCTILLLISKKPNDNKRIRMFEFFDAKKDAYKEELDRRVDQLNAKKSSCALDIRRQCELLKSKLSPFAHDFDTQMELLNSKIASYTNDLDEKMKQLNSHYASCTDSVEDELLLW